MLVQASTIQDIDRNIQRKRMEINALEQAKSVLTTAEPMNATATTQPAAKRGPGRPRKAGTQTRSASGKRGPGRPKGSGRKATKRRGPGRPKGSRNKPKGGDTPAITPGAAPESQVLWGGDAAPQN